jgi:hypothetical protein
MGLAKTASAAKPKASRAKGMYLDRQADVVKKELGLLEERCECFIKCPALN